MPLDQNNPWDDLDTPADGSTPKLDINAKEGRLLATDRVNGARGFGDGNFKALFEAIEREQALRGNL